MMKLQQSENLLLPYHNKYTNLYIIAVMIVIAIFFSVVIPSSELSTTPVMSIESVPKDMSISDYLTAPIDSLIGINDGETIKVGNSGLLNGSISLVLLILAIGSFISIVTRVGIFESIIETITNSNLQISRITILLCLYFILCAASFGLYESAVCYIPLLMQLYKRYNVSSEYPVKLLLLSLSVGYIGSPINPFATLIADQITGNSENLFVIRTIFLIVLTIFLIGYLLFDIRKYNIKNVSISEPTYPVNKLRTINLLIFLFPYVYMTIGFIPNFLFNASMSLVTIVFITCGLVIGLVNHLSLTESIDQMIMGLSNLMMIVVVITLARSIYIILYNSHVLDTIIYQIVTFISPLNSILILVVITIVFMIFSYIISSPSALAMITLPVFGSALNMAGISISSTVTLFLLIHGISKMGAITSPLVIASLNQSELTYQQLISSIKPFMVISLILGWMLVIYLV